MNKTFELIQQTNTKLDQFKLSFDSLINQNNEYINSVKRYSNKDFVLEIKEEESFEERKSKAETMIDQLEDIVKRSELEIQNIESFENKFEEVKKEIDNLKTNYLNEKKNSENKIKDIEKILVDEIGEIKMKELREYEEEFERKKKEVDNKYKQLSNQYSYYSTKIKLKSMMLEENELNQLEEWTGKKCSEVLFDSDKDDWNSNTVLNQRIMNKNQLSFVIEDEQNNKWRRKLD